MRSSDRHAFGPRLCGTVLTLIATLVTAFVGLASAGQAHANHAVSCPPLSPGGLEALRLTKGAKSTLRVVFFSTWCADCLPHLREAFAKGKHEDAIAVAVFDTRAKAESTLTKLGLYAPCYTDDGIAKHLGVKVVPAERQVGGRD